MPTRLPPLTSLKAFEAAGRHLSFTKAAAELAVTQAAISHQVKALEDHLDTALFERLPRNLELTTAGETLLPVVSDAFECIRLTIAALQPEAATSTTVLTVRLAPSFAAKWLLPRLDDFRQQYPDIELSLNHSNVAVNFARDAIDLAISYGKGDWPGVIAVPVLNLDFFPVCSPAHMQGDKALTQPENLRHYKLLHDGDYRNWSDWLTQAGFYEIDPTRGTIMDDTNVLIQAAIDGQGIALGSSSFVADLLDSGRLVKPFDRVLHSDNAYFVVCPEDHLERSEVNAFRDWLLEQSELTEENS